MLTLLAGLAVAAPPAKKPTDAERGKELYARHCVACHGAIGAGDGPAASALVVPVPDLRGKVSAGQPMVDLVRFGRGAMPAFDASLEVEDIRRVLAHMANAKVEPAPAEPEPPPADAAPPEDAQPPEGGG